MSESFEETVPNTGKLNNINVAIEANSPSRSRNAPVSPQPICARPIDPRREILEKVESEAGPLGTIHRASQHSGSEDGTS